MNHMTNELSDDCDGDIEIVQGADVTLTVKLTDGITGDPFDLTGFSSIVAKFKNADGTTLTITPTVTSAPGGKMTIALSHTQTAALESGEHENMEILITIASLIYKAQFKSRVNVIPSLF